MPRLSTAEISHRFTEDSEGLIHCVICKSFVHPDDCIHGVCEHCQEYKVELGGEFND